jgi:MYXO-CTERM domain-containing protein
VSNPCAGVVCPSFQFCSPDTGECVADPCTGQNCAVGAICSTQTGQCQPDPCLLTTCGYCTECVSDRYYMTASCEFQEGCGEVKIYAAGGCAVAPDESGGWRVLPLLLLLGLVIVRRRRAAGGGR